MTKTKIVIVPDDARVIRVSELERLYETAGDLRTLGEALGVSASTLSRALSGSRKVALAKGERVRKVRTQLRLKEPDG